MGANVVIKRAGGLPGIYTQWGYRSETVQGSRTGIASEQKNDEPLTCDVNAGCLTMMLQEFNGLSSRNEQE